MVCVWGGGVLSIDKIRSHSRFKLQTVGTGNTLGDHLSNYFLLYLGRSDCPQDQGRKTVLDLAGFTFSDWPERDTTGTISPRLY